MRRVLFLYGLWVLCLAAPMLGQAAKPWGVLDEVVSTDKSDFAIDHLLDNRPISYAVSKDITPQEEKILLKAFQEWPSATLQAIRAAGRSQEFADIVPLLQRGIALSKTKNENSADTTLQIDFDDSICGKEAVACYFQSTNELVVTEKDRNNMLADLIHEVGHYYGLGDQYDRCRNASHPIYSSDVNKTESSVLRDDLDKLTCDDVDGFINLIDLRLSQRTGKFSIRSRKGWKTFCGSSNNYYQEAKTSNRKQRDVMPAAADSTELSRIYDKKGNLISQEEDTFLDDNLLPLFGIKRKDKVTRESSTGKILSIESATGTPLCLARNGKPSVRTYTYNYNAIVVRCQAGSFDKTYSFPFSSGKDWSIYVTTSPSKRASRKQYDVTIRLHEHNFSSIGVCADSSSSYDMYCMRTKGPNDDFTVTLGLLSKKGQSFLLPQKKFNERLTDIPSIHRPLVTDMKDVYDHNAPYIRSFYFNFYRPALGMDTRTQTKAAVQGKLFTKK